MKENYELKYEPLLVNAKQAAKLCGMSLSGWYDFANAGMTPPSIYLGKRCRRWSVADLRKWCELGCPNSKKFIKVAKGIRRLKRRVKEKEKTLKDGNRAQRLTGSYVKQVICDGTNLKNGDIPAEVVKTKREHIKLKRQIRRSKK